MIQIRTITFILISCFAITGYTQIVKESWVRQAGIACGGGLGVEAQGEIDAILLNRLRAGKIQADGTLQKSEVETLLKQFEKDEKQEVYTNYVNCLINVMNAATNTSQLPSREVVLDSPVAPAPLETVKHGQRFVMSPGDTVAVKDHSIIFTFDQVSPRNNRIIYYSWSNSETGYGGSKYTYQSRTISLGKKCSLVPYKIDADKKQVSFLSHC